ncbi:MAG TPA: YbaN family protein [Hyphomicrobium sp.]|nr:YbaN family protein [Hyphomicrobium sp.]
MYRLVLIIVGCVATVLAVAGAMLPGLPTTPFLLIALWAFARSSDRMTGWLERIPILRQALAEARRFEERRTIRREVKALALAMAWGSVAFTAVAAGASHPILIGTVVAAALGGTFAMWWFPTER